MNQFKVIRRALISSALAIVLCFAMLVGTTYAWFTDEVKSSTNKVVTGTLKVDLELLDKTSGNWGSIKASKAPIFNYDKWEPGYTEVKILKVENEGTLALKWVAKFTSETALSSLADVIDVYVCASESEIGYPTDRALPGYTNVGTLREFIDTLSTTTWGTLEGGESAYLGLAFRMKTSADNSYQNMSLGGAFDIVIEATQWAHETDGFDNAYDN